MTRQLEQAAFLHSSKLLMLTEAVAGLPLPSLMFYLFSILGSTTKSTAEGNIAYWTFTEWAAENRLRSRAGARPVTRGHWSPSENVPILTQQFGQCILNTLTPTANLRNKYLPLITHRATQTLVIHPADSVECYAKRHQLQQGSER